MTTTKQPKHEEIKPIDHEAKLKLRRFLKRWLKEGTGCCIQHDGWTCGTCFYAFIDGIGIPEPLQHGFWQLVLAVRGYYDDFDWEQTATGKKGKHQVGSCDNGGS